MSISREKRAGAESRESEKLREILALGKLHRGLGLYLYLVHKYERTNSGASLEQLRTFYSRMVGRLVHEESVRKQLKLLMNKGIVREEGGVYYPVPLPAEAVAKLFDTKRAEAGQAGAVRRLRQVIYENQLPAARTLPSSLKHYIERIVREAEKLVEEGKREAALDLISHTLLPLRETGVLWLWKGEEFIYYERKTMREGIFHCVRFPVLAGLLKDLGFEEDIMVYHVLGHEEVARIIRKIFSRGFESWPWARAIFHTLKHLGVAGEGNYYVVELELRGQELWLYLRDYYGNTLTAYAAPWTGEPPVPLSHERTKAVYPVIGKQHVKPENEATYFSKYLG